MAKRLLDVLVASLGLLVLAPLLVVIACAVRLDSPGPALFRQTRISRGGRHFQILKFRTMRASPASDGPQIAAANDSRITRLGALLRRAKLDELPQLINVVKGDMSLVGPRPEVPEYVAFYPEELRDIVLSVRPGITDEASLRFRNEGMLLAGSADPERTYVEEILPKKLELYVRYVRGRTLCGDLGILLRTIGAVVRG